MQEVSKVGGIKAKEISYSSFPILSLAQYGILNNSFTSVSLSCYICYLGVIYFYLPGTALEWIMQGRIK